MTPGSEILVIGNYRQTLTVIRSLARSGHRVILGRSEPRVFTQYSRYIAQTWEHPNVDHNSREFLRTLSDFAKSHTGPLFVFPVGESELSVIARDFPDLPPADIVVMPDPATVLTCLNKAKFYEMASQLGLPFPDFRLANSLADLAAKTQDIGFPCVVKPIDSLTRFGDHKAVILSNRDQLLIELPTWPSEHELLIVQKFSSGRRHNCHFLADRGELLAYFEQRVLRTDRRDYTGYGVDGEAVPPAAVLRKHTAALIAELRYSGVGCAQFLVDDVQHTVSLLELNPRLDATCALPYYCGYDFPAMAVALAAYQRRLASKRPGNASIYPLRRGVWSSGDLIRLARDTWGGRVSRGAALGRLFQILRSFCLADSHLTWSWRDPLPTCCVLTEFLRAGFRRIGDLMAIHKPSDQSL